MKSTRGRGIGRTLGRFVAPFVASLLFAALPAGARGEDSDAATGLELRLSGTVGVLTNLAGRVEEANEDPSSPLSGVDLKGEPSFGFNAEIGYRIHPHLSIAAHVEHLAAISISVENGGRVGGQSGNGVLSARTWALTADARAYASTGRIQPFLTLGAGWMWADADDEPILQTTTGTDPDLRPIPTGIGTRDGFVARGGGGIDVYLGDSFFVTTQATYMVPVGRVRDFDYVSIAWGFGYLF